MKKYWIYVGGILAFSAIAVSACLHEKQMASAHIYLSHQTPYLSEHLDSEKKLLSLTEADVHKKEQQKAEQAAKRIALLKEQQKTKAVLVSRGIVNPNIRMPAEDQVFLKYQCDQYGLNYYDTLAVIQQESQFDPNKISSTQDYGYFQVNIENHQNLASLLKTPNTPLDRKINIKWGTYLLGTYFKEFKTKGLSGQALEEAVLTCYNAGPGWYTQFGIKTDYVQAHNQSLSQINQLF